MPRVAVQPDLFAAAEPGVTGPDPIATLTDLLARLRAATAPPWADAAAAMAEEHRILGLARQAGEEGSRLAAAILEETERLLSTG